MIRPDQEVFAEGYQAALADVLAALDRGGEASAREWIKCNIVLAEHIRKMKETRR